ncbi:MAG: hypothetical protein U0937_04245 [Thermodesulfovibrionia bacterium]|nr:hypothetical protein [Thermodesulfovibrionia bacterium]
MGYVDISDYKAFCEADFFKNVSYEGRTGKIPKADISKSVRIGHF